MAITPANATYLGSGPADSGQILAQAGIAGDASRVLFGFGTVTGDASLSLFSVNFIDGTKTLPFTPSGVMAFRVGGAATNTISVLATEGVTAAKFDCRTSAAINAATFSVAFIVLK